MEMSKLVVVTFRIDIETLEELEKIANELGFDRSDVIRLAIRELIRRYRQVGRLVI